MDTNKWVLSIGFILAIAGFGPWLLDQRGVHMPPLLILWCGIGAIVVLAYCFYYPFYPNLIAAVAIAFITGIAVTWWWIGPTHPVTSDAKSDETTHDVSLFLQFTDEHAIPKEIHQTNIRFWRALFTPSIYGDTKDANNQFTRVFSVPPHWYIILWFEKPARYRQMFVKCVGSENLSCAVQESNDSFAIVSVVGDVSRATLEASVVQ